MSRCCYKCTDRWVDAKKGTTCHGTCERYAKEVKADEQRRKQKQLENQYYTYMRDKKKTQ